MSAAASVVHDWLLVSRRQSHTALRNVTHELSFLLGSTHAHAPLCFPETVLVVEITIRSAAPRCLREVWVSGVMT